MVQDARHATAWPELGAMHLAAEGGWGSGGSRCGCPEGDAGGLDEKVVQKLLQAVMNHSSRVWIMEHGAQQLPWLPTLGQIPWRSMWPTSGAATRRTEEPREPARKQAEEKVFPSSPTVGRVRFPCQGRKRPSSSNAPSGPSLSASSIPLIDKIMRVDQTIKRWRAAKRLRFVACLRTQAPSPPKPVSSSADGRAGRGN